MTHVRAMQSFNAYIGGKTVEFKPGKLGEMPAGQAEDFKRAGLVQIVSSPVQPPQLAKSLYPDDSDRHGVFAIIVNYNMPERAEALVNYINWHCRNCEVVLVDNGSDLVPPPVHTNLQLLNNVQTTLGWLMGLHYVDALCRIRGIKPFAYWFLITSAEFIGDGDPLAPMVDLLRRSPAAVGVHPALTEDSTTAWSHMKTQGGGNPRRVWMVDNIASLYRASWFDQIGRFDPAMTYAWGIDLETGYLARQQGRGIYIHEGSQVKKVTDIGYSMNRMGMTAQERREKAGAQMTAVLSAKYGPEWNERLRNDYPVMDNELVSVIVPTYNRPELLARALDSIAAQTYPCFEAIVVNDGGCDVSQVVARHPFARLINHPENRGLPAARNTAIQTARGAYLAYLDDDDWYYPEHLETLVDAIRGRRAVYSDANGIWPDREQVYASKEYDHAALRDHALFPVCCVLHERSLLAQAGMFDETLKNHEDWDLWIRISDQWDWQHVPIVTCCVDRTRETMGSNREAMLAGFELVRQRYAK